MNRANEYKYRGRIEETEGGGAGGGGVKGRRKQVDKER